MIQSIKVNNHDNLPEVQFLLQEFLKLIKSRTEQSLESNTKATRIIDTGESYLPIPRSDNCQKKIMLTKQKFTALLQAGVTRPSKFPRSSPIHLVSKSTPGKWRVCGDFRLLNQLIKPDRYAILNSEELNFKKTVFSKIYLLLAYHQIHTNKADI